MRADSISEVVAIAQDFLDRLEAYEVDMLPVRCRPRPLHTLRDLNEYAYDLKSHYCEAETQKVVDRVAEVVVEAASRLSVVFGTGARPRPDILDWSGVARMGGGTASANPANPPT